jgi:cell division protease FtsH
MVTQYGMSERLGPLKLGHSDSQPFLGKEFGHEPDYSSEVAAEIDREIRVLVDEAHDEALEILATNRDVLEELAEALLEQETVEGSKLEEILAKIVARPSRKIKPLMNGAGDRATSQVVVRALRRGESFGVSPAPAASPASEDAP